MRFDAAEHLDIWKREKRFPTIHTAMAHFVAERARGRRVLDLCCNHGLLGEQLASTPWRVGEGLPFVVGIDGDARAMLRGRAAGIRMSMRHLRLDPSTYDDLEGFIREREVTVLVARRCLPEILGGVMWSAPAFAAALHAGGIREVFLQGRVPTPKAVSPLASLDQEIAALAPRFVEVAREGQCAYLEVA